MDFTKRIRKKEVVGKKAEKELEKIWNFKA